MNNQNGEVSTGNVFHSNFKKILCRIKVVNLLVIFGLLFLCGCTIAANQNSDGSWSYSGVIAIPVVEEKGAE